MCPYTRQRAYESYRTKVQRKRTEYGQDTRTTSGTDRKRRRERAEEEEHDAGFERDEYTYRGEGGKEK